VGGAGELVMLKEGVCDENLKYRVADYLRDVCALSCFYNPGSCLPADACFFLGGFWRMLRFLLNNYGRWHVGAAHRRAECGSTACCCSLGSVCVINENLDGLLALYSPSLVLCVQLLLHGSMDTASL
jgi:hypothetical protein